MGLWRCPWAVTGTCMLRNTVNEVWVHHCNVPSLVPRTHNVLVRVWEGLQSWSMNVYWGLYCFLWARIWQNNRDPWVAQSLQHQCPAPAWSSVQPLHPLTHLAEQWRGWSTGLSCLVLSAARHIPVSSVPSSFPRDWCISAKADLHGGTTNEKGWVLLKSFFKDSVSNKIYQMVCGLCTPGY